MPWYNKALFAAMAYELAHKCVILPHVRVCQLREPRDHEKEKNLRSLLLSECILPTVFATMGGITLAPYHLMGDLQRMEVAARGLDRELYGIGDIELKQYDNSRAQGFVTFMDLLFM